MRPHFLDVVGGETVRAEDVRDRREREVREMLVVDRVVQKPFEEAEQVRELEGRRPVVAEQHLRAGNEIVQVGDLGKHVVAHDQAGALALLDQALRRGTTEEVHERWHSPLLGGLRNVGRRIDPENRYAGADEVLEQVAVVRSELDDEVLRAQTKTLADHLHVLPCMLDEGRRIRREVRVLGEDLVRRHERLELDEVAPLAGEDMKREERLHVPDLLRTDEALAERRHAKVDDRQLERCAAEAARRVVVGGARRVRTHGLGVSRMQRDVNRRPSPEPARAM